MLCCGPGVEPLDPGSSETLAARFRALSDPTRVAIVNRLASTEECCVCDLNAAFDLSQPTISHHLKVLRDAGLTFTEPAGTARVVSLRRGDVDGRFPGLLAAVLAAAPVPA